VDKKIPMNGPSRPEEQRVPVSPGRRSYYDEVPDIMLEEDLSEAYEGPDSDLERGLAKPEGQVERTESSCGPRFGLSGKLKSWRAYRMSQLRKRSRHSYKQSRAVRDEIVSGKRKKKSALHGTGASLWYEAKNYYFVLLDWSWGFVFFLVTACYLLTIVFGSLVSWPLAMGIECETGQDTFIPGTFGIAAVFATANILTLGYGPCMPATYSTYIVASLQHYLGLILSVIVLSVVVAKFQIPKPDIIFSKKAVVTTRDGAPVLLIRVGNRRVNLLYETHVAVAMLRFKNTIEGEAYVEYIKLRVHFPPTMTAVATVVHHIDGSSPLRQILLVEGDLNTIALSVSFNGHDSIYNSELECTTQYMGTDLIIGGYLFGDMMEIIPGTGKGLRANFRKFDSIKEAENSTEHDLFESLTHMSSAIVNANSMGHSNVDVDHDSIGDGMTSFITESNGSGSSVSFKSRNSAILTNDVTGAQVTLAMPKLPHPNIVYLLYGSICCNGRFVRVCPYSRMVYMFLVESGISFEVIDIDWNNKPDWFMKIAPQGRTPVIHLGKKFTTNSTNIIQRLIRNFPEESASLNLTHDLPMNPFVFQESVEQFAFPVFLSTKEKMTAMLDPEMEDQMREESKKLHTSLPKSDGTKENQRIRRRDKLNREKLYKSDEVPEEDEIHVIVPTRYRGDRIARFCPNSQTLEVVLRLFKVPFYVAFVEEDDPPAWAPNGESGILYQGKAILGLSECLRWIAFEMYPKRYKMVAKERTMDEILALADKLMFVADAFTMRDHDAMEGEEYDELKATLDKVNDLLAANKEENGLNWHPYLYGNETLGLDDVILAPVLRYVVIGILEPLAGFRMHTHKYDAIQRYIQATFNTVLFRESTVGELPGPFYTLYTLSRYAKKKAGIRLPPRCKMNPKFTKAEEDANAAIFAEYGNDVVKILDDASIVAPGGVAGPCLETNTLYLAVGCVPRGDGLAKACPYSFVNEVVAREAGIPVQIILINLLKKPKWFTLTSSGKAPNAYWNGTWYSESSFILDMMGKLFPELACALDTSRPKLSYDVFDRLHKMDLFNAADNVFGGFLKAKKNDPKREERLDTMETALDAIEAALELSATNFMSNDIHPCYDEIALFASIWRQVKVCCGHFHGLRLEEKGYANIAKWLDFFEARDSFKLSMPPFPETFIIYSNARLNKSDDENVLVKMTPLIKDTERNALTNLRNSVFKKKENDFSMKQLAHYESVLEVIEDLLEQDDLYLCGRSLGLADILVFSVLHFTGHMIEMVHSMSYEGRGFPRVRDYVQRIQMMPRFRPVVSPAAPILFRIHASSRMRAEHPHMELNRVEEEQLELQAARIIESNDRRSQFGKTIVTTSSDGGSSSSDEIKPDIEDLLFCI